MKVTNSKQLSAYLKDIRQTRKLSQEKVACKVGIRQDTVSSFERNADATKLATTLRAAMSAMSATGGGSGAAAAGTSGSGGLATSAASSSTASARLPARSRFGRAAKPTSC